MGLFSWLKRGEKSADPKALRNEAAIIAAQRQELLHVLKRWEGELFPNGVETSKGKVELYRRKIALIQDKAYNPFARLTLIDTHAGDALLFTHIEQLEKAAQGDEAAVKEVRSSQEFVEKYIADTVAYFETRKQYHEERSKRIADFEQRDWSAVLKEEERQIEKAERDLSQFIAAAQPEPVNMREVRWQKFYYDCLVRIINNTLCYPARMMFTSLPLKQKEKFKLAYLGFLREFISGDFRHRHEFEKMVKEMRGIAEAEANRISRKLQGRESSTAA